MNRQTNGRSCGMVISYNAERRIYLSGLLLGSMLGGVAGFLFGGIIGAIGGTIAGAIAGFLGSALVCMVIDGIEEILTFIVYFGGGVFLLFVFLALWTPQEPKPEVQKPVVTEQQQPSPEEGKAAPTGQDSTTPTPP